MAQRYDIGDNSAYLEVAQNSTLAQISVILDNFLSYKGWTKIDTTSITSTLQRYTYSCPNLNGSIKRISVYVQGNPTSGVLRLGVSVHSDLLPAEQGMTLNIAQNEPDLLVNLSRWIVLRQASGNCQLYIFATQRWCLFMSSVLNQYTFTPCHTKAQSWDGNSTYYWNSACKPVIVPGADTGANPKDFYLPGYNNENGVTEYVYYGTTQPPNSATVYKRGAIGCVELGDTDMTFPAVYVDTAYLFMVMPETGNVDYLHKYLMTKAITNNNGYTVPSGEKGWMKPCNLRSDASDYLSVVPNPWNAKKLMHSIQLAHRAGYAGKVFGLKVAAEKASGTELLETNLKVDANYDFDSNGIRRKFFRIPGYNRFAGAYARFKFTYNPNKEPAQRSMRYDNNGTWLSAYIGNSLGNWTLESIAPFNIINDCGFLIPA